MSETSAIHQYAAILQSIDVGLFVVDLEFNLTLWNGFLENHSGIEPEDALGNNIFSIFPDLDQDWFSQKFEMLKIIKNQAFTTWEQRPYILKFPNYRPITGTAPYMYQNATLIPLLGTTGEVDAMCVIIYDKTSAAINKMALDDNATQMLLIDTIDPHTWFHDETWWAELIDYEYQRAQRTHESITIALFQIDTGTILPEDDMMDAYLGDVVKDITLSLRQTDKFARIAPNMIAVLLVSTDLQSAQTFIHRVKNAFNNHQYEWQNKIYQFKCDAGWSQLEKTDKSEDDWSNRAAAMLPNLFD